MTVHVMRPAWSPLPPRDQDGVLTPAEARTALASLKHGSLTVTAAKNRWICVLSERIPNSDTPGFGAALR